MSFTGHSVKEIEADAQVLSHGIRVVGPEEGVIDDLVISRETAQ